MRLTFLIVAIGTLMFGCGRRAQTRLSDSEKWEYAEINWPTLEDENLWGSEFIHLKLTISDEGEERTEEIYSRTEALSDLGKMGWELAWVSPGGVDYILKRPGSYPGSFRFVKVIDYEGARKKRIEDDNRERAQKQKEQAEYQKHIDDILHSQDNNGVDVQQVVADNNVDEERRKTAEKERVQKGLQSTIKWLQKQAESGDAFSQFRLGERYLKGDGVDKDESKAREYLTRASVQGNQDAKDLLAQLNSRISTTK